MSDAPLKVVIAGGGVAGLETMMSVRALAGDRVDVTLVAPVDEFVYRPLAASEPFRVGALRRISLDRAADEAGATFIGATLRAVEPGRRTLVVGESTRRSYDALVLAVGARAEPAVAHAGTWDDRSDAETLGGLLQDAEQGYIRRLAVVLPYGPGWPLRAYELALFITRDATGMGADLRTTLVTPDPSPLDALAPDAVERVHAELERAGIAIVSAAGVDVERDRGLALVLQPSGQRLEVDRVLALPVLRGRPIEGVAGDAGGFVEVDERCRVRGLERVWAVGDCTAFGVKSGGFASAQADAAAADIAAMAGADVTPETFDPARVAAPSGLPTGRHLAAWLAAGEPDASTTHLPGSGVPVLTYLQRDFEAGWRGTS